MCACVQSLCMAAVCTGMCRRVCRHVCDLLWQICTFMFVWWVCFYLVINRMCHVERGGKGVLPDDHNQAKRSSTSVPRRIMVYVFTRASPCTTAHQQHSSVIPELVLNDAPSARRKNNTTQRWLPCSLFDYFMLTGAVFFSGPEVEMGTNSLSCSSCDLSITAGCHFCSGTEAEVGTNSAAGAATLVAAESQYILTTCAAVHVWARVGDVVSVTRREKAKIRDGIHNRQSAILVPTITS